MQEVNRSYEKLIDCVKSKRLFEGRKLNSRWVGSEKKKNTTQLNPYFMNWVGLGLKLI